MTDDQNRLLVIIIDEKEVVKVSRNLLNADFADEADFHGTDGFRLIRSIRQIRVQKLGFNLIRRRR